MLTTSTSSHTRLYYFILSLNYFTLQFAFYNLFGLLVCLVYRLSSIFWCISIRHVGLSVHLVGPESDVHSLICISVHVMKLTPCERDFSHRCVFVNCFVFTRPCCVVSNIANSGFVSSRSYIWCWWFITNTATIRSQRGAQYTTRQLSPFSCWLDPAERKALSRGRTSHRIQ